MRWMVTAALVLSACGDGTGGSAQLGPPKPPPTVRLNVHVEGPGSLQASGLANDCHAGCEGSVPANTVLRFIAAPDLPATFDGWTGACTGIANCELTLAADTEVTARFSIHDDCTDVMPASMGTPVKRNLAKYSGSRSHCDGAIADGSGNVAHATIGGLGLSVWQVYATDGSDRGTFFSEPYEVQGATVGCLGLTGSYLTLWSPDGVKLAQNTVVSDFDASWLLPATTGGIVVVVTDSWGCPKGVDGISTMKVYRFADSGGLVSGVDIGGRGCPVGGSPELSGASDDKGNTVVAVSLGYRGA